MDKINKIELIIFDFDGTLYESLEVNYRSINEALYKLGISYRVDKRVLSEHLGETSVEFYGNILSEEIRDRWQDIRLENRKNTVKIAPKYAKAFPGVVEGLKILRDRGYKLALYSNCSPGYLETAARAIGVMDLFDYVECVGQNNLNKIQLVKKIKERFNNSSAAVVGDKAHDIKAAKENDCISVGVLYGYGKEEPYEAEATINSFEDLTRMLP